MIEEGDTVILKRHHICKIVNINKNREEKFENLKFSLQNAIGLPYGTQFTVSDNNVHKISLADRIRLDQDDSKHCESGHFEDNKDNRNLKDSTTNQNLQVQQIEEMKRAGVGGQQLLKEFISKSNSFSDKTKFSQEKYINRKKKRHLMYFTIQNANLRNLCNMYFQTGRSKIVGLRLDTLSQILYYANVHAGSRVLLSETAAGLVMSSILERLGPSELGGHVLHFYHGNTPPKVELSNAAKRGYDRQVYSIPLCEVWSLLLTGKYTEAHVEESKPISKTAPAELETNSCKDAETVDEAVNTDDSGGDSAEEEKDADTNDKQTCRYNEQNASECDRAENVEPKRGRKRKWPTREEQESRRLARRRHLSLARSKLYGLPISEDAKDQSEKCPNNLSSEEKTGGSWPEAEVDCLIVATRFHPVDLSLTLLQLLPIGKPFVIFCGFLQPLVELFNILKQRGGFVRVRITDCWLREIQVLPERTHPEVKMSSSGGYLLCGYKVADTGRQDLLTAEGLLKQGFIKSSKCSTMRTD